MSPRLHTPYHKVTSVPSASCGLKVSWAGVVLGFLASPSCPEALVCLALHSGNTSGKEVMANTSQTSAGQEVPCLSVCLLWIAQTCWEGCSENLQATRTVGAWSPQVSKEVTLLLIPWKGLSFGVFSSTPLVEKSW